MEYWYFAYVQCTPSKSVFDPDWPKCICLSHPVLLTKSWEKASQFSQDVQLKCPADYCNHICRPSTHQPVIQKVTLPYQLQFSRIQIETTGKIVLPMLCIGYFEENEELKYGWSFDYRDIPVNTVIRYEEPIYPGVPMKIRSD